VYLTNPVVEFGEGLGPLNRAGLRTEKDSEIFSPIYYAHLTPVRAELVEISPDVFNIAFTSFNARYYHDTLARFQGEPRHFLEGAELIMKNSDGFKYLESNPDVVGTGSDSAERSVFEAYAKDVQEGINDNDKQGARQWAPL
jgi:hypothetical protein